MSSLLSYHIFSFFISNFFENFKFRRNFLKFTAGIGYRLVAVSGKFGGNRRLPTGKVNRQDPPHLTRHFQPNSLPPLLLLSESERDRSGGNSRSHTARSARRGAFTPMAPPLSVPFLRGLQRKPSVSVHKHHNSPSPSGL